MRISLFFLFLNIKIIILRSVEKFKGGSNNFKEESTSNNCIPEKMKGGQNSVRDEASKSGKQASLLASGTSQNRLVS